MFLGALDHQDLCKQDADFSCDDWRFPPESQRGHIHAAGRMEVQGGEGDSDSEGGDRAPRMGTVRATRAPAALKNLTVTNKI